jgi:opacity protein-like surface antigen
LDKIVIRLTIAIFIFGASFVPSALYGVELTPERAAAKGFAGGRFGVWTGTTNQNALDANGQPLEFAKSSLYAEFFYSQRVVPSLAVEFSIGIFSRGDFKYLASEDVMLGTVNLYPAFLSAKFFPLGSLTRTPLQPFFQAGGGLIYASQSAIDYYYDVTFTQESKTRLSYFLGGGLDWPVADQIGLCFNYKYMPLEFGSTMAGIKNYSGWEISFGMGYIFNTKK